MWFRGAGQVLNHPCNAATLRTCAVVPCRSHMCDPNLSRHLNSKLRKIVQVSNTMTSARLYPPWFRDRCCFVAKLLFDTGSVLTNVC